MCRGKKLGICRGQKLGICRGERLRVCRGERLGVSIWVRGWEAGRGVKARSPLGVWRPSP